MNLIFEKSRPGRGCALLPPLDVPEVVLPLELQRKLPLRLPELSENDLSRHYTALAKRCFGVNCGFYPLGSCTMKYNPKINEQIASLEGFIDIHPLQPTHTVQGCLEVLRKSEELLCEVTGMDAMTFQPAAGAHGEYVGLLLIKAYHDSRGDSARRVILVPDTAHGTNPASAAMAGFEVVGVPSAADGCVDLEKLKECLGPQTAGLMLTNPNTLGLFEKDILEISRMVHEAGGLIYYDGANLNAILGIVRPGDMGFDVIHLNLHKTFATPHGGGGPGSGAVGCKELLIPFLPVGRPIPKDGKLAAIEDGEASIGRVKAFHGNFLVVVRALTYLLMLGEKGLREVSENAVLNANYLMRRLEGTYKMAYRGPCMHEFVMTLENLKEQTGVSALDIAKGLLDEGMHPPTMYFPLIVHEALMVEPTETESKETLDEAVDAFLRVYRKAIECPQALHDSPITTCIHRPDDVRAARKPVIKYDFIK